MSLGGSMNMTFNCGSPKSLIGLISLLDCRYFLKTEISVQLPMLEAAYSNFSQDGVHQIP